MPASAALPLPSDRAAAATSRTATHGVLELLPIAAVMAGADHGRLTLQSGNAAFRRIGASGEAAAHSLSDSAVCV